MNHEDFEKIMGQKLIYTTYKFNIDEDLGIMYQDSGPWRSYQLTASGNTFEELLEDATISEVDQDGGELNCYGLDDADTEVERETIKLIKDIMNAGSKKNTES